MQDAAQHPAIINLRFTAEVRQSSLDRRPLHVVQPGEAHDSTAYVDLLEERDSDPGILLADRGYDSDAITPSRHQAGRT